MGDDIDWSSLVILRRVQKELEESLLPLFSVTLGQTQHTWYTLYASILYTVLLPVHTAIFCMPLYLYTWILPYSVLICILCRPLNHLRRRRNVLRLLCSGSCPCGCLLSETAFTNPADSGIRAGLFLPGGCCMLCMLCMLCLYRSLYRSLYPSLYTVCILSVDNIRGIYLRGLILCILCIL